MIITFQGFGHFTQGLNNQDFGMETSRMLLILDGCSGAKYSEVGTRLFAQLLSKKEEWDNVEKFEDNVESVNDININYISLDKGFIYIPNQDCLHIVNTRDQFLTKKMECHKIMTPTSRLYNINTKGFSVITDHTFYEVRRG